jgi:ABC-type multidrug transport system fused ATPase/permease subunit
LHTVAYYDKIIVMHEGAVAEIGAPIELLDRQDSLFRKMSIASGDYENVVRIARAASRIRE